MRELVFRARQLYKELSVLGRSYPDPNYRFHEKLRRCFAPQAGQRDEEQLKSAIAKAEFIKKEIETLYFLKKYRAMRRAYPKLEE
ncbi:uncharacterized protein L969DRAFT_101374 [Mixia osmundae IAM 14324]|uniref:Mitochondrial zinc maintenance protein 1, mitochondrial n=1 Tax=Mixia osmundae (strain CBS 9802 / IAM 14324 / JCM 22182 / KY 12970) TaxID=764103 RepID=G7DXR1_MIXOS|nr:uncharacterized protein L969DRAFT_101374 [Mixia osmundae IAM 14324]KEI41142.1 hypothetical protein L969DRAFT_101374 [Mixia osmundae IAM 14324]GAA95371.1 hypothetical protein E5Q_02025 [Mixia osmundae IAM 14324]